MICTSREIFTKKVGNSAIHPCDEDNYSCVTVDFDAKIKIAYDPDDDDD